MTQDRVTQTLERVRAKRSEEKPLKILYEHRALGTPFHPAQEIAEDTIDVFQKVASKVPGTFYHKMTSNDQIWPIGESHVSLHTNTEIVQTLKALEETGRPTLSYNNGVYCFVGYETRGKTAEHRNVGAEIYLFTDHALADALKKEIGEIGEGYVPCSNGETRFPHSDKVSDDRWVDALQRWTREAHQKAIVNAKAKEKMQSL